MKRVAGKREIEAVCDSWENGIVGYLYHKLLWVDEIDGDMDGIDFAELQEEQAEGEIVNEDVGIDFEDTLDDHLYTEFMDEGDDTLFFVDGHDGDCDIYMDETDEGDSETGFESKQDDDLLNI
jgi:hypothetical protein